MDARGETRERLFFELVRFDEASSAPYDGRMSVSNRDVMAVQRYYPQIYLACHTRHQRRRSNPASLTATESSISALRCAKTPLRAATLARHLGVSPSSLSAVIKRLVAHGYIVRQQDPKDRRVAGLRLSPLGNRAMQASSVLETRRVARLLERLSAPDRIRALAGLQLLADAARGLTQR
jgi:DNA-binding MarR family transcriptional regulator